MIQEGGDRMTNSEAHEKEGGGMRANCTSRSYAEGAENGNLRK
jgi:hypothetical protein